MTARHSFDATVGHRVRSATYRASLNGTSTEEITEVTASRDLRQLSEDGLLEAVGEKRGRHYRATTDLQALWRAITDARKKKNRVDPFLKPEKRN